MEDFETQKVEANESASVAHYAINPSMSRFTVQVFADGWLSAAAHNPTIAIRHLFGEVAFDSEAPDRISLTITIDADSLEVAGNSCGKDRPEVERRMRHQVLETDRFSQIVYECTQGNANRTGEGVYLATLNGELSMHGVTRAQTITAYVSVIGDGFKANGSFTLKQTDYEIPLVSALGGAIRVKDELKFSFDLAAKKVE